MAHRARGRVTIAHCGVLVVVVLLSRGLWPTPRTPVAPVNEFVRAPDVEAVAPTRLPRVVQTMPRDAPIAAAGPSRHLRVPKQGYLLVGNTFGRHSNQMVSLTTAMAFAKRLGRIAVLPPLMFGGKGGGGSKTIQVNELFQLSPPVNGSVRCVPSGACAILEVDFVRELQTAEARNGSSAGGPARRLPAGCMSMRGVPTVPRHPNGAVVECNRTVFVKFKKRYSDVLGAAKALDAHTYIMAPLVMYLAEALGDDTLNAWQLFNPPAEVQATVDALRFAAGRALTSSTSRAATPFVAVHLRSLEGSCRDRAGAYVKEELFGPHGAARAWGTHGARASDAKEATMLIQAQCDMTGSYIGRFRAELAASAKRRAVPGTGTPIAWCFLADDGQQPALVKSLTSTMPLLRSGDVVDASDGHVARLAAFGVGQDATAASSAWQAAKTFVTQLLKQRTTQQLLANPFSNQTVVPSRFFRTAHAKLAESTYWMLVDFWMLVEADVFVGNQLSTLSVNACRKRLSMGRTCDNFVSRG